MITDEYLEYILTVRRYSPRTADVYAQVLSDFCSFTLCSDDTTLLESLTPGLLRAYEVHLLDEMGDNSRTVHLHLSVLSGFCRYLMKTSRLDSNPVRLLPRPKMEKRLPVFYRDESMKEYFSMTESFVETPDMCMKTRYEARLRRLIVSMLFNTGMRRSELISIRRKDVDFQRGKIRVLGKGGKMREIPLVDCLSKEISLYLDSVAEMVDCGLTSDDPLLVTVKGKKLYPVFVDRAIKQELGAVGSITGRKSPHVLRHSLATELLNEGTDLESIKELLGHSSLAATQVYTHASVQRLKSVYNSAHPRAKSGK